MATVVSSGQRSLFVRAAVRERRAERWDDRLVLAYRIIGVVTALVFALFIGAKCFTALSDYDGMYNSILPKNFSIGAGYKTTYPAHQGYIDRNKADQDRYFNVEVTTGPSVLFFSIPFLLVFGQQYWVPAVSAASLSALLLASSLFWLWRFWPEFGRSSHTRRYWWGCLALTFLLLISFTADVHWPGNPSGIGRAWFEAVGEVPASLFTILGSLILFGRGAHPGWAIVGGFLLGLAILAKSLAGIACGVVLVCFVLWRIFQRRSWKQIVVPGGLAMGATAAPLFAYNRLIEHVLGSPDAIEEWRVANRALFSAVGSGITQLNAAPSKLIYLLSNLSQHMTAFFSQYPIGQVALVATASLALIGVIFMGMKRARRSLTTGEALGLTLIAAVIVHYGWWFLLEHYAWIRRLTQANVLLAFALALLVSQTKSKGLRLAATGLLLIAALGPGLWRFAAAYHTAFAKEPRLLALEQIRPVIDKARARDMILLGCGWAANREIDFLMPTSRSVYDCTAIQPAGWGKQAILIRGFYWFLAEKDARVRAIQEACERNILVGNEFFTVSLCPDQAIEQNYMWIGFYQAEPQGRWMGKSAIMPIMSWQRGSELKLILTTTNPDRIVRPVVGSVQIQAEGKTKLTRSISIGEEGRQEILVPESILSNADSVAINVDRTFNPAKLGLSPDVRDLGVLVTTR